MKLRITTVLSLLALSWGFISCGPEQNLPDAKLFSMSIGSSVYSVEAERIPAGISNNDYVNYFDSIGYRYDYETLGFNKEDEGYTEGMRIRVTVSDGARAEWGVGGRSERPGKFYSTGVPVEFKASQYIYIKVTSMDGYVINYYRFYALIFSTVNEMRDMVVAGRYARMAGAGNTPQEAKNGEISITETEAEEAIFAPVTFDDNATVGYYVGIHPDQQDFTDDFDYQTLEYTWITDPDDRTKTIKDWKTKVRVEDNTWLYVKVTAQNKEDILYYRFWLYTGRMSTVKAVKFIGNANISYEAVGKGAPAFTWAGVSPGSFESPHQATNGFRINIELDDPAGTYQYARIASTGAGQPTGAQWQLPSNTPILFANNEALAVRVTPKNDAGRIQYYKVKVGLLATDFKEHPKAAVYDVGATATPLTFTLDRTLPVGTTYQWYEANSWYGGYGFDADGDITDGIGPGAFDEDDYHRPNLDEKSNVSFHNGGNQFYRLPTPGRKIPVEKGGTTPTYTPPTTNRPFIGGFSNVTNYYWVVITTPSNLVATSKRAVIVTEHNEVWDLGVNTHRSTTVNGVKKKHLIIDMPNLKKDGVSVPIRNINAFTKFRQPFKIDLTGALPPGFNIKDYSMATAQALFFLRDGTPWIQNWTQGNISFIESNSQDGDKDKIVLYYNLTNNNGTLGLKGDGKEPSGGSLDKPFTHVVVMPSGEKPIRNMPPLLDDGTPDPEDGDAQGWFCGFIELVELRFEGPAQP